MELLAVGAETIDHSRGLVRVSESLIEWSRVLCETASILAEQAGLWWGTRDGGALAVAPRLPPGATDEDGGDVGSAQNPMAPPLRPNSPVVDSGGDRRGR